MSRTFQLAIAGTVVAGIAAAIVTAFRQTPGNLAVGVGSPVSAPADQRAGPVATRTPEGPVSQTRPVLVLLPEASAPQHVARLQRAYRVLTMLRPRIVVLQVGEEAVTALRQDPALTGVYEEAVPPEVLAALRPDERLFVEGWVQQQASMDKKRRGDGLSWDAPGFQPPGPPTKKQP
jgi:hypothetical protein